MKQKQLLEELLTLASEQGFVIRKEKGNFKTGYCVFNNQKMLLINKATPLETTISVVSSGLSKYCKNVYIKPILREYLDELSK